jgi:hypothetical protein
MAPSATIQNQKDFTLKLFQPAEIVPKWTPRRKKIQWRTFRPLPHPLWCTPRGQYWSSSLCTLCFTTAPHCPVCCCQQYSHSSWTHCYHSTPQCFTTATYLSCLLLSAVQPQFHGCAEPNLITVQTGCSRERGTVLELCVLLSASELLLPNEVCARDFRIEGTDCPHVCCCTFCLWHCHCLMVVLFCSAAVSKWKLSTVSVRRGKGGGADTSCCAG